MAVARGKAPLLFVPAAPLMVSQMPFASANGILETLPYFDRIRSLPWRAARADTKKSVGCPCNRYSQR